MESRRALDDTSFFTRDWKTKCRRLSPVAFLVIFQQHAAVATVAGRATLHFVTLVKNILRTFLFVFPFLHRLNARLNYIVSVVRSGIKAKGELFSKHNG